MAGGGGGEGGRSLEQTPTWAVALVCFVFVLISIIMEQSLHLLGRWLTKKNKRALYEALEKIKSELMLLGFISLLLTVGQDPISRICVSPSLGSTMLPCRRQNTKYYNKQGKGGSKGDLKGFSDDGSSRKLLWRQDPGVDPRRMLAGGGGGTDKCAAKGMVPLVSAQGINQLHLFIFVLAVFHVLYCILTMALGRLKMRSWTKSEEESKTLEYHFSHDPERFRFARETSFGRRHMNFWSRSSVLIWIVCFFRQFFASVSKVDYLTLRHGFIMAHLSPHTTSRFDFQKYINRSLEEDFKVVVGISPVIWFVAMLFILFFTHGLYSYLWLPFIPLIIILLVGTKLQVVITRMALQIQEKGDIVKGVPVVEPTDHLFWFRKPRFILYLIHFVLFQNAFQLAFFVWAWYQFGLRSCFHEHEADIAIRLSMGVLIQFLCSYVTLPLYALVTQMGSTMKPTIFEERVANALRSWHHTARKHVKETRRGTSSTAPTTPRSSDPNTPTRGLSPVHLLRHYRSGIDSAHASPARYYNNNDSPSPSYHAVGEGSSSHHHHQRHGSFGAAGNELHELQEMRTADDIVIEVSHDNISEGRSKEFSFAKGDTRNQVAHRK